jgi:hypothetical protein
VHVNWASECLDGVVLSVDSEHGFSACEAMVSFLHHTIFTVHRFLVSMQTGLTIDSLLPFLAEINGLCLRHVSTLWVTRRVNRFTPLRCSVLYTFEQ